MAHFFLFYYECNFVICYMLFFTVMKLLDGDAAYQGELDVHSPACVYDLMFNADIKDFDSDCDQRVFQSPQALRLRYPAILVRGLTCPPPIEVSLMGSQKGISPEGRRGASPRARSA